MKKALLVAFMLIGLVFTAEAQKISKNALGLRLGDNDGFGGEISYQRGLSKTNRLELDLGWRDNNVFSAVKVAGLYQWVWNIDGGFNWYAGIGGGLGTWSYNDNWKNNNKFFNNNNNDGGAYFFAAGDIGIEYDFDIPLMISLDLRPELYLNDYGVGENFGPDIALGIRYQF